MKLVMTKEKPAATLCRHIAEELNGSLSSYDYDGQSTRRIAEYIAMEPEESVLVTADSRIMQFVHTEIGLKNTYVFQEQKLIPLQHATQRILRPAHNLMSLYEANEFTEKQ